MTHWDRQSQLVFLGDLIDRGEDSRKVIELVKDVVEQQGAICLSGNHEYMFLAWIDNPTERYDHYRRNGGGHDHQLSTWSSPHGSSRWREGCSARARDLWGPRHFHPFASFCL